MNRTPLDNSYNKATTRNFTMAFSGLGLVFTAVILFAFWGALIWVQLISLVPGFIIGMPMVILGVVACMCDDAKYKYYEELIERGK